MEAPLEVTQEVWGHAFRAAMAHRKMICKARGGEVWETEVPIEVKVVNPIIYRTSANTEKPAFGRRLNKETVIPAPPSGRQYKKRHYLVGRLRGKLVPWVFGSEDVEFESLIGVSREIFRDHIESQFTEGMNWANHGYWHLDHILPVSSFNHDDPEQVKKCWHFTNFQPLWGRHNLKKGAKLNHGKNTDRTNLGMAEAQPREVPGLHAGVYETEASLAENRKETVD